MIFQLAVEKLDTKIVKPLLANVPSQAVEVIRKIDTLARFENLSTGIKMEKERREEGNSCGRGVLVVLRCSFAIVALGVVLCCALFRSFMLSCFFSYPNRSHLTHTYNPSTQA